MLLGSSTWPGEEEALLRVLRDARGAGLKVSLLLVPRHAERRGSLEPLLRDSGFSFHFRSRGTASGTVDVCVADTTSELRQLTQLADLVFVGKSLPPHTEGQTPVEAAALEKPILFGPGMGNFRQIARYLQEAGAARVVRSGKELVAESIALLQDEPRRHGHRGPDLAPRQPGRGRAHAHHSPRRAREGARLIAKGGARDPSRAVRFVRTVHNCRKPRICRGNYGARSFTSQKLGLTLFLPSHGHEFGNAECRAEPDDRLRHHDERFAGADFLRGVQLAAGTFGQHVDRTHHRQSDHARHVQFDRQRHE